MFQESPVSCDACTEISKFPLGEAAGKLAVNSPVEVTVLPRPWLVR